MGLPTLYNKENLEDHLNAMTSSSSMQRRSMCAIWSVSFDRIDSLAFGRMPGDSCESIGEEEEEEEDSNENEATSADDDQSPEARVSYYKLTSWLAKRHKRVCPSVGPQRF